MPSPAEKLRTAAVAAVLAARLPDRFPDADAASELATAVISAVRAPLDTAAVWSAEASAERSLEDRVDVRDGLRLRYLRVLGTVRDTLEWYGIDSSACLGVGGGIDADDDTIRRSFDEVLAGWSGLRYPGEPYPTELFDSLRETFPDFERDGYGAALAAWEADADSWRDRYRRAVTTAVTNVLQPAQLDDEAWSLFLYADVSDLREMQAQLLARLHPSDLPDAGVTPTADGRWLGLSVDENS